MSAEHRVSRKQLLKEPDAFQVASSRFMDRLLANRISILVILGGVILLAGGLAFVQSYRENQSLDMEKLYFEMTQIRSATDQPPEETLKKLQAKLQEFTDGPQKLRAELLFADTQFQYRKYDEALQGYRELKGSAGTDDLVGAFAELGLAHTLEAKKDYKGAIAAYKSLIDSPGSLPLFYVYLGLARSYEQSGDAQNALLVLRDMKSRFPNHGDIPQVDSMTQRLEAKS